MKTRTAAEDLEVLKNNLRALGLKYMAEDLDGYLDECQKRKLGVIESMVHITENELLKKKERHIQACVNTANFPYRKSLDDFDFDFQPTINRAQIEGFRDLRFLERNQNIILIGSPGVGKTHIATAIGIEAAKNGKSTYFIPAMDLLANLKKAALENRLEDRIKQYSRYRLLIIDELGFLQIDDESTRLFFYLISKRHGKKSTIVTTNCEIKNWPDTFKDSIIANAIFDRLADFKSPVITIIGPSYRTRHLLMADEN